MALKNFIFRENWGLWVRWLVLINYKLQSSSSEKKKKKEKRKIGKTSKKLLFWAQFAQKKRSLSAMPKMKNKFFLADIRKADHQLSETFYFIKISYVLAELWTFFYLEWYFLSKKCHFHLKQLHHGNSLNSVNNSHITRCLCFRFVTEDFCSSPQP